MDDAARVFKDMCLWYKPDLYTYNTLVTGYARMVGGVASQGAVLYIAHAAAETWNHLLLFCCSANCCCAALLTAVMLHC